MKSERSNVIKRESTINDHLFLACIVITVISMVTQVAQFFMRENFPPSCKMSLFYIGILAIYAVHKEMLRWLGKKKLERKGESFVYSWIMLTVTLYLINFLTKCYFCTTLNGEDAEALNGITLTTFEVCGIFVLSRLSKVFKINFQRK